MAETNSEMWLDRTLRTGGCGTWWTAATASGQPLGLLQLEPALLAQPAVQNRVATAVAAVRAANPRGVLRTTDLVVDARRAWLVVAGIPTPTLADLLAARTPLDPGAAAGIAVDTAQALRDLHAVGLSHSDLAPDTVVLTPGGSATLVEVGVLAAVRDRPTDVGQDVTAWAALVRDLAPVVGSPVEADLLARAAAMADTGDLATAVRQLAASAADLPDFAGRESLAAIRPSLAPAPPRIPTQRSTVDSELGSTVDELAAGRIRIRFGRGVPDTAIEAARAPAVVPRRRRPVRAFQLAALVMVLLLGVGAAVLAYLMLS